MAGKKAIVGGEPSGVVLVTTPLIPLEGEQPLKQQLDAPGGLGQRKAYVASSRPFDANPTLPQQQMTTIVANDMDKVPELVEQLMKGLPAHDDGALFGIQLTLTELIANAIEHGNLAISFQEKSAAKDGGTYTKLWTDRAKDARYKRRRVHITQTRKGDTVTFVIRDEGKGFDTSKLPKADEGEGLLRQHGRGILLSRNMMDEVRYNKKGNQVTVIKTFTPAPDPAAVG